jgi:Rad3-related DNA helicase
MTYTEKEATFQKQLKIIGKILKKYEKEKGIIHTTNYELSNWINKSIKDKRFVFHDSENREDQFEKFKKKNKGIMVSPSMISGISLDDDMSRFQILLKIPYPNISSNKIKARQASNKNWYSWRTAVDVIQAYGRSIRSDEDWAHTYVLDTSFGDLLRYNGNLFPKYFTDAIRLVK